MTDELLPPTLEELDAEIRFVMDEMDMARARGIATNVILIETLAMLSQNRLIDGKQLCAKLTELLPNIEPETAKIALAFEIDHLTTRLQTAPLNA